MPVYNAPIASLSTLTPQQQENLILMADTDVRSILQSLETVAALQITQSASIARNAAGLTGLRVVTVVEKVKQLERANFVFAAGFWNINVLHELQNQYPITAIFDASGDVQFIQFVGKDANNGTVELTQSQYDSNSFPLTIVLHGRASTVGTGSTAGQWKLNTATNTYYRFVNSIVEESNDGINANTNKTTWPLVSVYMNVANGLLVFVHDVSYYTVPLIGLGGAWSYINLTQYQGYVSDPSTISL